MSLSKNKYSFFAQSLPHVECVDKNMYSLSSGVLHGLFSKNFLTTKHLVKCVFFFPLFDIVAVVFFVAEMDYEFEPIMLNNI